MKQLQYTKNYNQILKEKEKKKRTAIFFNGYV